MRCADGTRCSHEHCISSCVIVESLRVGREETCIVKFNNATNTRQVINKRTLADVYKVFTFDHIG